MSKLMQPGSIPTMTEGRRKALYKYNHSPKRYEAMRRYEATPEAKMLKHFRDMTPASKLRHRLNEQRRRRQAWLNATQS